MIFLSISMDCLPRPASLSIGGFLWPTIPTSGRQATGGGVESGTVARYVTPHKWMARIASITEKAVGYRGSEGNTIEGI